MITQENSLENFHSQLRQLEGYPIIGLIPSSVRAIYSTAEIATGVFTAVIFCPCHCCSPECGFPPPSAFYISDGIKGLSESLMNICSLTIYQTAKQNHFCAKSLSLDGRTYGAI